MPGLSELVTERVASLDELPSWPELATASGNPFAHPAWLRAWWEALASDRELLAYACHDGSGTFALLPLSRDAEGTVRFVGDDLSDLVAPVCAPDRGADAHLLLARVLGEQLGPRGRFLATSVEHVEAAAMAGAIGGRATTDQVAPWVDSASRSWDEYLRPPHARRRRRIARRAAHLFEEAGCVVPVATTAADVRVALEDLVQLHEARLPHSRTFAGRRLDFFRQAVPALAEDGAASITSVTVDGATIAAMLVLHSSDVDWYYQSGWDPSMARLSPGRAVLVACMQRAFDDGRSRFHLLRGDEVYKTYWTDSFDALARVTVEPHR